MEKVYFVKFHPLAKDVVASASFDLTCKIWDLAAGEVKIALEGHTESVSRGSILNCQSVEVSKPVLGGLIRALNFW